MSQPTSPRPDDGTGPWAGGPQQGGQPPGAATYPSPTSGGPGGPAYAPANAFSPTSERNWAMAAHLSGFAAAYVALGFLGPLVVMLVAGDRSPYVRRHAVEALNFNLSWLLYIAVAVVLSFVLIGLPILVALGVGYLVLVVLAAVEASKGNEYRYPLTIRLVS